MPCDSSVTFQLLGSNSLVHSPLLTGGAGPSHREIYQQLKDRKILIRYMRFPDAAAGAGTSSEVDGLRITVGTEPEIDGLLSALKDVLA